LAPPKFKGGALASDFDWHAVIQIVRTTYPEAELRSISLPTKAGQLIRIRMRQPFEWLPNGRTQFWFDPATAKLVKVSGAEALPLATRAYNIIYPIHASSVGGVVYKIVVTAVGLTLTMLGTLAVWGFWSYQVRRSQSVAHSRPAM